MQITEVSVLDYNWSLISVFVLLFPFDSAKFLSSLWYKHRTMQPTEKNDQSEFNFVLAESSSIRNKFHLFHCSQDAFIVTHKLLSWYLSIATASHIQFLHHWYQKSIPDRSCLMLTKDKNVKRDTNALAMLSYSYLYDKLNNALWYDSFILSENNLPIV